MLEFLFKLLGMKRKVEGEQKRDFLLIRENELSQFVDSQIVNSNNLIMKDILNFASLINEKLYKLENSVYLLEQENISLPDKQIEKIVNTKKHEFLGKIKQAIEKVKEVDTSNVEKFSKTYEIASLKLREVNATSLKDFLNIRNYFSNSKVILESFKDLFDNFYSFQDKLKSEQFLEVTELKKVYSDYCWIKDEISSKKNELEKLKSEIEEKRKEVERKKEELLKLENSDEMKRLLELQKEKMRISYKEKELASICVEKYSSLEHIFKKLKRQLENKNLREARIITEFINSPFDATINFDMQKILDDIVSFMKNTNFSNDEISKIEDLVREEFFLRLKKEYFDLENRLKEIEDEIEKIDIVNRKLKIENEVKSLEFDLEELNKKLESLDKKLKELEDLLPKLKETLETKLSKVSGKEIKILD
jgi:predicted  nucleic acid-binding Zn-ribbon protein